MKTVKYLSAIICLAMVALASLPACKQAGKRAQKESGLKGTISISGAWALYPITVKWAEKFRVLHPNVRIDISAGGAGKGFTDAMSGMVDLGMFSRGFTQVELDRGVWFVGVTKDAVIPVVNAANPFLDQIKKRGVTREELQRIFVESNLKSWNELLNFEGAEEKIHIFTRSDASGAAEMWAAYLGVHQENLQGTGVFGDPGIASAVRNDIYGIGYNNVNYVYDLQTRVPYEGLQAFPLDINGNNMIDPEEDFYTTLDELNKAIKDGIYPAPPARPLYFVANGKPTNPAIIEFLRWILVEGQQYVGIAGYVPLTQEYIDQQLQKLN